MTFCTIFNGFLIYFLSEYAQQILYFCGKFVCWFKDIPKFLAFECVRKSYIQRKPDKYINVIMNFERIFQICWWWADSGRWNMKVYFSRAVSYRINAVIQQMKLISWNLAFTLVNIFEIFVVKFREFKDCAESCLTRNWWAGKPRTTENELVDFFRIVDASNQPADSYAFFRSYKIFAFMMRATWILTAQCVWCVCVQIYAWVWLCVRVCVHHSCSLCNLFCMLAIYSF